MSSNETETLVVVGALFLSVLVWLCVVGLSALAGGWRRLSTEFAAQAPAAGNPVRFVSARMGIVDYSGVLHIIVSDLGLGMTPTLLFRPFHPRLLIPWAEMSVTPEVGAFLRHVHLTFPSVPGVRIRVSGRMLQAVRPYLNRVSSEPAGASR